LKDPQQDSDTNTEPSPVLIQEQATGQCPSISGRSTITFAIGRHPVDGGLHLAITGNDGGGLFYDGWASGDAIDAMVKGSSELTSKTFQALHRGRSVNTAGFVMATLKHLGLIRQNPENTRLHEHTPATNFELVANDFLDSAKDPAGKARRHSKGKKGDA
jgi:hypothetical protein